MANPLVDLVDSAQATVYLTELGQTAPADLDKIITGVSAAMQSYASRNFVSQAYAVTLDGAGSDRVSLPNTPITAVASVSIDGVSVPPAPTVTSSGFVFSDTQVLLRGYRFCRGVQNAAIAYTAGFATIPADIVRACCEGIGAAVAQLELSDPRIVEVAAGGTKYRLGSLTELAKVCLTAGVTQVLDQYRRVIPC